MSDSEEHVRRFKEALEPYIKPREQVNYIRRILALNLEANSPEGLIRRPLSLADGDGAATVSPSARGSHKEYLEALKANVEARQKFESLIKAQARPSPEHRPTTPTEATSFLSERIALLRLQKKRERLLVIKDHLDKLAEDPAASDSYLDPARVFKDVTPLPEVPQEIVSSMIAAHTSKPQDLKTQVANLEKVALRARVLCKQEEQLLAQARRNAESLPEVVSNGARLEALSATRNELINWIESELSNAAEDDPDGGAEAETDAGEPVDQASIDAKLLQVKKKYEQYVSSRRDLLDMLSQQPHQSSVPSLKPREAEEIVDDSEPPSDYLLTPYIEQLLALSRTQKAMISQKSHVGNALSKQAKDTCQSLGHLAEESQLLPAYPMKDSMRRRSGLQDELTGRGSGRPDIAQRIKPWAFAADSAKIASLEAVTEHVERGQISLEATMQSVEEMNKLLGQPGAQKPEEDTSKGDETEEDVWLAGASPQKEAGGRKHTVKGPTTVHGDPWSSLHGSLGLIGSDDVG